MLNHRADSQPVLIRPTERKNAESFNLPLIPRNEPAQKPSNLIPISRRPISSIEDLSTSNINELAISNSKGLTNSNNNGLTSSSINGLSSSNPIISVTQRLLFLPKIEQVTQPSTGIIIQPKATIATKPIVVSSHKINSIQNVSPQNGIETKVAPRIPEKKFGSVPSDPVPSNPASSNPVPSNPASSNPVPSNPVSSIPVSTIQQIQQGTN